MKRRLTPILTFTVALILVGSLAYAADKRKQARQANQPPEPVAEEEALKAELLEAVEEHQEKLPAASGSRKVAGNRTHEKKGREKVSK